MFAKYALQEVTEKTGQKWYKLVEMDGGEVKCPHSFANPREKLSCSSKCGYWANQCKIESIEGIQLFNKPK